METKTGEMVDFGDVKPFTGEPETAMGLIANGNALIQSKAGYHTAVRVQVPRDLDRIVKAVEREAEFAGDNFYYSWLVKDKRSGQKKPIIGGTVGAALAIARNWMNCAVPVDVQELPGHWIFTATFVDLETGFSVTRTFRKSRPRKAAGDYDNERYEDMMFQKGQSQAIRNVIFAGVPAWLKNKAISKAQEAAKSSITKDGIDQARNKAVAWLKSQKVSDEQIKAVFDKPFADFTIEDVQMLRNMCQQIQNGDTTVDEAFPPLTNAPKEDKTKTTRAKKSEPGKIATPEHMNHIIDLCTAYEYEFDEAIVSAMTETEYSETVKFIHECAASEGREMKS
jgi:hypothetical protein